MARIRTIKPEFWQNESLAGVTEHARLLAIALLNQADDKGYFLANPSLVRSSCFPFEDSSEKVRGSLQELSRIGYIQVRECSGKAIGMVCKFLDHQRIDKPQKSKLAEIYESCEAVDDPVAVEGGGKAERVPGEDRAAESPAKDEGNADSTNVLGMFQDHSKNGPRLEQGTGNREQGSGTGEMEQGTVSCSASEAEAEPPAIALAFPCRGTPAEWKLTEAQVDEWSQVYPSIDVLAECRKALAWVKANNLKTAKGMPKFLVSWLGRANDAPSRASRGSPMQPKTFAEIRQENTRKAFEEVFGNDTTSDSAEPAGFIRDVRQ